MGKGKERRKLQHGHDYDHGRRRIKTRNFIVLVLLLYGTAVSLLYRSSTGPCKLHSHWRKEDEVAVERHSLCLVVNFFSERVKSSGLMIALATDHQAQLRRFQARGKGWHSMSSPWVPYYLGLVWVRGKEEQGGKRGESLPSSASNSKGTQRNPKERGFTLEEASLRPALGKC